MITVDSLIRRASSMTNVTVAQIYGPSHKRYICAVRCAVYIVAKQHGIKVTQIARRMERDHSTIISAINNESLYRLKYPQITRLIQSLQTGDDKPCPFVNRKIKSVQHKSTIRFYTPRELLRIDQLVHDGMRLADIAEQTGRTHDSLASARKKWLKKHPERRIIRVSNQPERKPRKLWTQDEIDHAARLRNNGLSWAEVTHRTGIPACTVICRLKRDAPQSRPQSVPRSGLDRPDRQCHPT